MKILALVTARSNSRRLPGKNIRLLGGKPLLLWSIDAAKGIEEICDILVSTDDHKIAELAQQAGALAPWLRPIELASDTATSIDVALHALDWYESTYGAVDGLMLLQPTSPFRDKNTIKQAIALFDANGRRPVLGVSPAATHPAWCYRIKNNHLLPYSVSDSEGTPLRSQDLPPVYALNGAMYLADPAYLRSARTFLGIDAQPLLMEKPSDAMDIDTAFDFMVAECIAATMGNCVTD